MLLNCSIARKEVTRNVSSIDKNFNYREVSFIFCSVLRQFRASRIFTVQLGKATCKKPVDEFYKRKKRRAAAQLEVNEQLNL